MDPQTDDGRIAAWRRDRLIIISALIVAVVLPPPNPVMLLAGGLQYFVRSEPVAMAAATPG